MKPIFLLVAFFFASTQSLAPYIKPCYLNKPNFNKCALESANHAIPTLVKGDKKNNIPKMNPLQLPLVELAQNNFKLTLKNLSIYGLDKASVTDIKLNKTHFEITIITDKLSFISDYQIDGKIVFLKLNGSGPSNITLVGGHYRFIGTLETFSKNKMTFLKLNKPVMEYTLNRCYFNFGNILSDGDQSGIDLNKILNDNWEDVLKDVDEAIKDTVAILIDLIVNKILQSEPAKNIFPD